jgi:hypothetical protein
VNVWELNAVLVYEFEAAVFAVRAAGIGLEEEGYRGESISFGVGKFGAEVKEEFEAGG